MAPPESQSRRISLDSLLGSSSAMLQAHWQNFIAPDPQLTSLRRIVGTGQIVQELQARAGQPLQALSHTELLQLYKAVGQKPRVRFPGRRKVHQELLNILHTTKNTQQLCSDLIRWQAVAEQKQEDPLRVHLIFLAEMLFRTLYQEKSLVTRQHRAFIKHGAHWAVRGMLQYDPEIHLTFEDYARQQITETFRNPR